MLPGKIEDGNFVSVIKRWRDMWNNMLRDHLLSMRIVAGSGIRVQQGACGTVISATGSSGGGMVSGGFSDEGGPFAVTIANDEDGDSILLLHNSKSESGTAGMVTIGSYREKIEDQQWPAAEGVIYMDVTYDDDSEEYTVVFDLEDDVPDTGDEKRYILRIAEITLEEGSLTVSQIRPCGDIEVTGRWVK